MKQKTIFVCTECGYNSPKWLGKCPTCNNWNTFSEEEEIPASKYEIPRTSELLIKHPPKKISEIENENETRMPS